MAREAVAVFCGPQSFSEWRERPYLGRIMHGIQCARRYEVPLLIAGDGFGGAEVEQHVRLARQQGLERVVGLFDPAIPRPNTLTDARLILRHLAQVRTVGMVHVVTDEWHVLRAGNMLRGEAQRMRARHSVLAGLGINFAPVYDGYPADEAVRASEERGLKQYLEDPENYGNSRPEVNPLRRQVPARVSAK